MRISGSRRLLLAVAVVAAVGFGCRGKEDEAAKLSERAAKLYADEKYEDAARLYEEIITDWPESPKAADAGVRRKLCRAKVFFAQARRRGRSGRYAEAGDLLVKAAALAPDDVEVNYGIGWVYIQLALDNLAKAQMTTGRSRGDYGLLAEAHGELARARFERCLELDDKHWAGYRGLAIYYLYTRDYDKALGELSRAEKYSKKPAEKVAVGRLRFQVYAGRRDMVKAKEVIDGLVDKYPQRGDVYFSLAEYYLRLEEPNLEGAARALQVGVTKDFDDEGTRNQMYVMLSRLLLTSKEYDDALAAAEKALRTDPFNELITDQYTLAYEAQKKAPPKE